jgi:hypothetical protein
MVFKIKEKLVKLFLLFAMVLMAPAARAQTVTTVLFSANDSNYFFTRFQSLEPIVTTNPANSADYSKAFNFASGNGAFKAKCETKYSAGLEIGPRTCVFAYDESKSDESTTISRGAHESSIVALMKNPLDFHTLWTVVGEPSSGSVLIQGIDIVAVSSPSGTTVEPKIQMSCGNSYCAVTVFNP